VPVTSSLRSTPDRIAGKAILARYWCIGEPENRSPECRSIKRARLKYRPLLDCAGERLGLFFVICVLAGVPSLLQLAWLQRRGHFVRLVAKTS